MSFTSDIRQEVFKQMPNLDISMVDFNRIVDAAIQSVQSHLTPKNPNTKLTEESLFYNQFEVKLIKGLHRLHDRD